MGGRNIIRGRKNTRLNGVIEILKRREDIKGDSNSHRQLEFKK